MTKINKREARKKYLNGNEVFILDKSTPTNIDKAVKLVWNCDFDILVSWEANNSFNCSEKRVNFYTR